MVHVAVGDEDVLDAGLGREVAQESQPARIDGHDVIDHVGGQEGPTAPLSRSTADGTSVIFTVRPSPDPGSKVDLDDGIMPRYPTPESIKPSLARETPAATLEFFVDTSTSGFVIVIHDTRKAYREVSKKIVRDNRKSLKSS